MNFHTTQTLLDAIKPYFDLDNIKLSTNNKDWKGRPYQSDYVTLIENQNVHFEVFDNEIIVAFFTEHLHFEDYSSDLNDGNPDYIQRAAEFLKQLFTLPIRKFDIYKGKRISGYKYYLLQPDGTEERISASWYGFRFLNPFAKKETEITTWQYDTGKKCFTTVMEWKDDPDAIETIAVNDEWRIEIYEKNGVYTYWINHLEFDDYDGYYFWTPKDDGTRSFFDTKEKAIEAAKMKVGK